MRLLLTPSYPKADTPLKAAATTDSVAYELAVTNTGLLEVFNISVVAWGDGSGVTGALTCTDVDGEQHIVGGSTYGSPNNLTHESLRVEGLANYPESGLKGGSSMTCAFSSAVGQTEVSFRLSVPVKRGTKCSQSDHQHWPSGGHNVRSATRSSDGALTALAARCETQLAFVSRN